MHKHVCASEIKDLQIVFRMFDFVKNPQSTRWESQGLKPQFKL